MMHWMYGEFTVLVELLGTILLGVFAYSHINGQSGLLEGNVSFFVK